MSYTPYNAPILSGLLGDMEIAAQFSVKADIAAMLAFEAGLANAQAQAGLFEQVHADKIAEICKTFEPDMRALNAGTIRDGMAVPEFVRGLREACGEAGKFLHFGATSQDVVDTSLALRLKQVNEILVALLETLIAAVSSLESKFGDKVLMARTRMQAALPVTVGHRLAQWKKPLADRLDELANIRSQVEAVQLGGPVGDLAKMGEKGEAIRAALAQELGLNDPGCCWHTDRARLVHYCNWLTLTCAVLGKIGQDFALMAQNGIDEIAFDGAGGSSAMAHKQNPVKAEVLVAQARFAATLHSGMQQASVHEQERSGASWTLEWMILPQICVVTGSALKNAEALLESVTGVG